MADANLQECKAFCFLWLTFSTEMKRSDYIKLIARSTSRKFNSLSSAPNVDKLVGHIFINNVYLNYVQPRYKKEEGEELKQRKEENIKRKQIEHKN